MPARVPFGHRGRGGRNKEGLGDFIRRWEGREETPPPEQYMELKLPEGLGWLALFIAYAYIHTYIRMVIHVFFSPRLYWSFSGKDPGLLSHCSSWETIVPPRKQGRA